MEHHAVVAICPARPLIDLLANKAILNSQEIMRKNLVIEKMAKLIVEAVPVFITYNGCSTEGAGRELRDLESSLDGHESEVVLFEIGCDAGGSAELWTIKDGSHVPRVSETFSSQVVEWLYAHPKQ